MLLQVDHYQHDWMAIVDIRSFTLVTYSIPKVHANIYSYIGQHVNVFAMFASLIGVHLTNSIRNHVWLLCDY